MVQEFLRQFEFKSNRLSVVLAALAVLTGLILSIMYRFEVCKEACSSTASFKIFGFDFSLFGVVFFSLSLLLLAVRQHFHFAHILLLICFLGAAGAELHFIWLQMYVIGKWCPLCLSIAATVYCGCAVFLYETVRLATIGRRLKLLFVIIAVMTIGTTISVLGVSGEDQEGLDYYLGDRKRDVTVYFITDWFCPACSRLEPVIAETCPVILKHARVTFVDYPVNRETSNFTPYNRQFLKNEKRKYLQLRGALLKLSKKTRTPSDADVQSAIDSLGVKLKQIDSSDVFYGLQASLDIYAKFDVTSVPAVVVVHHVNSKSRVISGSEQITSQSILAAIGEISR